MTNNIEQEIKKIEIPSELHKRSKSGILKAKSEMRGNRRKLSKLLPYFATAACLAILIPLGLSFHINKLSKQARQNVSAQNPPKIIHFNNPKSVNQIENDNQGQENQQLKALENMTIDHSEYSSFKYFLADTDRQKNADLQQYTPFISGAYLYPKYFMASETDPIIKADEKAVMDQATKVILSNHAKKDVDNLKALISKMDAKYKNYSADGSYQGLTGDYREIADLAKNYQLPKLGIVPRSSKPSWYGVDPNLVIYKNGYGFNKKTGENTEIVVPHGQTIKQPTKEQFLGVIEGKTSGLAGTVGNPKDVEGFKENLKDIRMKLESIDEMKSYTGDYSLIQSKLDQIKSSLKESEANGSSDQTLKKAIQLYDQAVLDGKELYHAFQVGQELRNASN